MDQGENISLLPTPINTGEIVLYQPNDQLSLEVKLENETVWLTQQQMAILFGVKENNITYHIQSVFKTHELDPEATTQKIRVVRKEGNLIIDDFLYHCGHSLKDMGRKLSAITLMGTSPETILGEIR